MTLITLPAGCPPLGLPVELNRESPQANGLLVAMLDPRRAHNAVTGERSTITGTRLVARDTLGLARMFGAPLGGAATDKILLSTVLPAMPSVSYAMWVWRNGNGPGNFGRIFEVNSAEFMANWGVTNLDYAFGRMTSGTDTLVIFPSPTGLKWHHIIVTNDGTPSTPGGWTAYVDGLPVTVSTITSGTGTMNSAGAMRVGNDSGAGTIAWDGYLADARVYNRVLSAQEAYAIWAPQTRWDLYRPLVRRAVVRTAAVAAGSRYLLERPEGLVSGGLVHA